MYKIKDNIDLEILRFFGFSKGREYPDNERCIDNDWERDDFWLIPYDPDYPDKIFYADDEYDQPIWSIHVQSNRRLWIDCVPNGTYYIDNMDMEDKFSVLYKMIKEGIIEDI